MRTPRTLVLALTSALAVSFTPAVAADLLPSNQNSEQVEIEVDLDASLEDKIRSIRAQAWSVCDPSDSVYPSARNAVRRDCQKQVVADVLAQLSETQDLVMAEAE
ncbi:MAG: UrcA family protein [Pseudomonadota bacterium]